MNNADLIVATLKRAGITVGFGIPSGNVLPLMEAMRTGGIEFVLTAHEGSAGFAADVMGRQTGAPGLAIATLGPGATNLATGVGCAYLDRTPMIAITCTLPRDQHAHRRQMQIDHHALFSPITKASFALNSGEISSTLRKALEIALTAPLGPVHLDLPEDVATALTTEQVPEITAGGSLAPPSSDQLIQAGDLLSTAMYPIAVIGANARNLLQPERLLEFIEAHEMPFATTTMAKGVINENHPLSIGCIERGCRQFQRQFLRRADLIIGIGYDMIEVEYEAWIGDLPLLHIDIEAGVFESSVDVQAQVVGNLDKAVRQLGEVEAGTNDWLEQDLADHRSAFNAALRPESQNFTPAQAIDVIRTVLPTDGILAFDVGAHTHQIAAQWVTPGRNKFLVTNGWSSMGFGLPAAIAAKLASPELPVVCVLGDGCFQMTCGELAVARRLGLSLPVVVLDDGWLGLMKVKQERNQMPVYNTALRTDSPDSPPAHYFGVPAIGVRDGQELIASLTQALASDGPTVIEALVDVAQYDTTVFD